MLRLAFVLYVPFLQVVEHADEIVTYKAGSVEESFWYMVREGGLWESLEGASDWIADFLLRCAHETYPDCTIHY